MTKRTKNTKSLSFLLEYLFVLFFFALSAMICIQIYAKSIVMNTSANIEKAAMDYAQEAIEQQAFTQSAYQYLDEDGQIVDQDQAMFILTCQKSDTRFPHYNVNVQYDDEQILSLPFYQKGVVAYE